jgi:uncharacterized protein
MASDRDGNPARVILFDTNGLMMASQFTLDVFAEVRGLVGEYHPVILTGVIRELQHLSQGRGNNASAARYALMLSRMCEVISYEEEKTSVDDSIVRYAQETRCIVVTNDRNLRNRLLTNYIDVISLTNKKKLELIRG